MNLNDLINVEPISIGHGQYGQVHKGLLDVGKGMTVEVAVKMCRQDAEEENSADFFHEAEMTGSLWHPNVVRFIGIAVMGDPLMLVMEWCGGGSLESKLLKNAQLSDGDEGKLLNSEKIRLARMAAMGMEYIHRKGVIHR